MDEFVQTMSDPGAEFYLATVTAYASTGVKIRLDGQSEAMTKRYKMLQVGRPVAIGERVIVMKMSGTYVVIGAVSNPISKSTIIDLPTNNSSVSLVSSRVNQILQWMRNQGMIN